MDLDFLFPPEFICPQNQTQRPREDRVPGLTLHNPSLAPPNDF